jgi:archaellum component FlaG (FlaF/FlaG flagellin family)
MIVFMAAGVAAFSLPKAKSARIAGCSWIAYPFTVNPTDIPSNSSDNAETFFIENTGSVNVAVTLTTPSSTGNVTVTGYDPPSGTIIPGSGSREDFEVVFSTGSAGSGSVTLNFTTNCGGGSSQQSFTIDP